MITRRNMVAAIAGAVCLTATSARAAPLNTVLAVKPVSQSHDWSCWLAAAAILLQWKNNIPYTEASVAKLAGPEYQDAFAHDRGLNGNNFLAFASALGLKTEAPRNLTPAGYHDLIKAHGPLWVGSRLDKGTEKARRHIRVLRGITGDGTFDGSTAWVIDPDGGRDYTETVTKFAIELETIAREEIGLGNELYPQIIRFP